WATRSARAGLLLLLRERGFGTNKHGTPTQHRLSSPAVRGAFYARTHFAFFRIRTFRPSLGCRIRAAGPARRATRRVPPGARAIAAPRWSSAARHERLAER